MRLSRILVVEDEPDVRFLIRLVFETAGYEVIEASDGAAALTAVRGGRPDLVVTDVMMPVMGGIELMRHLRADPVTSSIPIMVVSGNCELAVDADKALEKPFKKQDLLTTARDLLSRGGDGEPDGPGHRLAVLKDGEASDHAEPLLPGEDLHNASATEATVWVGVYSLMIEITDGLLETARRSAGMAADVHDLNIFGLEQRLDLHRQRRQHWQWRHFALTGMQIDEERRTLSHLGQQKRLTRREHQLLTYLARSPGQHFHPQRIINGAWPDGSVSVQQVRNYILRLRRVMAELNLPCEICNEPGTGYAVVPQGAAAAVW